MDLSDEDLIPIELIVNGKPVKRRSLPKQSLLRFLRDELGLMGTKDGCSNGHCGACSVIIDGKLTRSCLVKVNRLGRCEDRNDRGTGCQW